MLRWKRREALAWQRSEFGDLPVLGPENARALQHLLVLAGGLALILSRATKDELDNRFRCSEYLYRELKSQLGGGARSLSIAADVMGEALHEIAGVADPMTNAAARACFDACVAASRQTPPERHKVESRLNTRSGAAESPGFTIAPTAKLPVVTQVNLEELMERSNKLRSAVAFARTTTFGSQETRTAR